MVSGCTCIQVPAPSLRPNTAMAAMVVLQRKLTQGQPIEIDPDTRRTLFAALNAARGSQVLSSDPRYIALLKLLSRIDGNNAETATLDSRDHLPSSNSFAREGSTPKGQGNDERLRGRLWTEFQDGGDPSSAAQGKGGGISLPVSLPPTDLGEPPDQQAHHVSEAPRVFPRDGQPDVDQSLASKVSDSAASAVHLLEPRCGTASPLDAEQIATLKLQRLALGYVGRGIALPPGLRRSLVDSMERHSDSTQDETGVAVEKTAFVGRQTEPPGALLEGFSQAVLHHKKRLSAAELRERKESRLRCRVESRQKELQDSLTKLPVHIQRQSAIEQRALRLLDVQRKVRYQVAAEKRLLDACSGPHQVLFDWGLLRPRRADVAAALSRWDLRGGAVSQSAAELDIRQRRKRDAERKQREEEEKRQREAQARSRFLAELGNAVKELGLQGQAAGKRRKQRNDGVLAWHVKQRQRASRAERLRVQALKTGDQEAYLQMVEESKNERLKTLLGKTDELLQRLGVMVQQQKNLPDYEKAGGHKGREKGGRERERSRELGREGEEGPRALGEAGQGLTAGEPEERAGLGLAEEKGAEGKKRDLLEGQRRYNLAVHAIEEKVTIQPEALQGGQLREYQLEGLQWMLSLYNNSLNGILADEMGLGKTIQTIALLAYLAEKKGLTGPHLVLAPKAVLPNWAHEFATWLPSMTVVVYDGKQEDRKAMRETYGGEGKFNVMITHYDLIMRDKAFLKKIRWHYLIVDEGHRLKNHESMLAKTLVAGYMIRRRLLLTGTPIQNNLSELWALLNFLLPAIFNSSGNFEEWFNAPFADKAEAVLTEEEELLVIRRLHQVIRPFLLRRKKAEVEKHLPQKTQVILKSDMSAWQRAYYSQILNEGRVGLKDSLGSNKKGQSRSLQNTAMQLRKCCNHPFLFLDYETWGHLDRMDMVRASGKFELLDRLLPKLRATGHRVLLFSQMTSLMDILEDFLSWRGFRYLRLDGNTKTEERGTLLTQFNAPDSPYFMFLLSTRAGGLGLNLQTADTVILFDSDWNPQMDQQAEDRAHRIGQKKEVRVFVLVSVGSIEEEILERAKTKMGIDAKVIQAGLFNTTSTAAERRQLLEEIMRKGGSRLGSDLPSEEEVNRLIARSDAEVEIFGKMDEERKRTMGGRGRKMPLMTEEEVPEWVFYTPEAEAGEREAEGAILGGKRKRSQVVNLDLLSEAQWQMVEDGADVGEVIRAREERKQRMREKKRLRREEGGGEEGEGEDEEEEEGGKEERGQGSDRAGVPNRKRQAETPPPLAKKQRTGEGGSEPMSVKIKKVKLQLGARDERAERDWHRETGEWDNTHMRGERRAVPEHGEDGLGEARGEGVPEPGLGAARKRSGPGRPRKAETEARRGLSGVHRSEISESGHYGAPPSSSPHLKRKRKDESRMGRWKGAGDEEADDGDALRFEDPEREDYERPRSGQARRAGGRSNQERGSRLEDRGWRKGPADSERSLSLGIQEGGEEVKQPSLIVKFNKRDFRGSMHSGGENQYESAGRRAKGN